MVIFIFQCRTGPKRQSEYESLNTLEEEGVKMIVDLWLFCVYYKSERYSCLICHCHLHPLLSCLVLALSRLLSQYGLSNPTLMPAWPFLSLPAGVMVRTPAYSPVLSFSCGVDPNISQPARALVQPLPFSAIYRSPLHCLSSSRMASYQKHHILGVVVFPDVADVLDTIDNRAPSHGQSPLDGI